MSDSLVNRIQYWVLEIAKDEIEPIGFNCPQVSTPEYKLKALQELEDEMEKAIKYEKLQFEIEQENNSTTHNMYFAPTLCFTFCYISVTKSSPLQIQFPTFWFAFLCTQI